MASVVEYVYRHSLETPDKLAVITKNSQTTYSELWKMVWEYAEYLKTSGLQKKNIVVVRASQTLDYVVTYLSVHLAGGIITSLEKSIPFNSLMSVAVSLNAKAVIVDDHPSDQWDGYIFLNPWHNVERADKIPLENIVFPQEDDSADILFTTGTTGASKGVELSHRALVATAENLIYGCQYCKDTVLIAPGPLNHANAIRKLFTTMVMGSTIYIVDGMANVRDFFMALDWPCEKISCCLPPAAIRVIFQMTKDKIGDYADKIDFIESASAPLPEPDKLRLCRLLPRTRLYNNYGSSESASVCMYDYNAFPGKSGCIGKAMPNAHIIVVDDDKREMVSSSDNMGLLACEGDMNMKGYVNDPELTREVLINGIVYTNDIGYIDSEGFVYIAGRKGDVINVGGLKVAPAEVESAALEMDGIEDCICIPSSHPINGSIPKLLIVARKGQQIDFKAIKHYLAERLEWFKVPQEYEVVDRIARTYNGKLDRKFYRQ